MSERELAVLRAVVEAGGSVKVAAHRLGISPHTVRNHKSNAYRKLDAQTLIEAARAVGWLR